MTDKSIEAAARALMNARGYAHEYMAKADARAAIAAFLEAQWEPIETAPKDGTRILAVSEGADFDDHDIVRWADHREEGGWYNGDWTHDADRFTHWMPLPQPPRAAPDASTGG